MYQVTAVPAVATALNKRSNVQKIYDIIVSNTAVDIYVNIDWLPTSLSRKFFTIAGINVRIKPKLITLNRVSCHIAKTNGIRDYK